LPNGQAAKNLSEKCGILIPSGGWGNVCPRQGLAAARGFRAGAAEDGVLCSGSYVESGADPLQGSVVPSIIGIARLSMHHRCASTGTMSLIVFSTFVPSAQFMRELYLTPPTAGFLGGLVE